MARSLLDRTLEALFDDARPREDLEEGDPLAPGESTVRAVLGRADERAAIAAAVLLLGKVGERGGTRIDRAVLERLSDRFLTQFTEMEQARIKREVARTLLWLWEAMGGEEGDDEARPAMGGEGGGDEDEDETTLLIPDRIYAVGDKVERIREAIDRKQDLEIDYYTFYRGKLDWRRVSPVRLESNEYLIAWCHMRQDERRFRVTRIRALRILPRAPAGPQGGPPAP